MTVRRPRGAVPYRRVSLLVVAVAAAFIAYGTAGAAALGPAATGQRPSANQSGTRVFTFVYSGSGFVEVVQHVDNRPGHAGPEWNDTFTKQVRWEISWRVTIEDGRIIKVSAPTGDVSGKASAKFKSSTGQDCGPSEVSKPVVNGKPYIGTNFEVVNTTKQFITVRISGFPVAWAAAPACLYGEGTVSHVSTTYSRASVAWGKSWGAPEFKIAPATNNYKITPAEVPAPSEARFPFKPVGINKKVVFDWSGRLKLAGYGSNGPGPPPAKPKSCTPAARPPQPFDKADVDNYLRSFGPEVEKWVRDVGAEEIPEDSSLPPEANENWEIYSAGCRAETAGGLGQLDGPGPGIPLDDYFRERRALPPDLMIYPTDFAATSSPDVLTVTGDGSRSGSLRSPSSVQAAGAPSARWGIRVRINSAGVKAMRSGKPFPVTLTATFRVKGKPPIRATTRIVLQGPRPVAVARIDSVTFGGNPQSPSIVVRGKNLGSRPAAKPPGSPSNQPLCPATIQGNAGLDYGTRLYLVDTDTQWAAGRYRPSIGELDCIGLIVTKFTSSEVDFRFGGAYAQLYPKYTLASGDAVQVAVNGASKTVRVKYGTP